MALTDMIRALPRLQEGEPVPSDGDSEPLLKTHFDWAGLQQQIVEGYAAFRDNFVSLGSLWQVLAVLAAGLIGYFLSRYPFKKLAA